MSKFEIIVFLIEALALVASAFFWTSKIRSLKAQIAEFEEKNKDAEISRKVHALSDDELDSLLKEREPGGNKPPAA